MSRVRFHRVALVPLAVFISITWIGDSGALATTPTSAATAYNRALADAIAKKFVAVNGTATATGFRAVVADRSGPTIAEETTTLTYSGPSFKLVDVVIGKSLYLTATAAALTDDLNFSKANAATYQNKPLLLPQSNSLYLSSINGATTPSGVASIRMKGTVTEGKPFHYRGQLVNVYSGTSVATPGSPPGPETVYVSTTSDPLPVLVKGSSNGLTFTESFSNWGGTFKVAAPLNAITIQPAWTKK